MFILILTLLGTSYHSGHAITAVPGFTSEASCMQAAREWVKHSDGAAPILRALCVKA